MKNNILAALMLGSCLLPASVMAREAAQPAKLNVTLGGIREAAPIPEKFAFCMPDSKGGTKDGGNLNPSLRWSGAPSETKSFAVLVVDKDVPASFELANQKGKVIPKDFKRQDFYHWVLVDVPAKTKRIPQGKASNGVIKSGKPLGATAYGVNGRNDYATFMKGTFGGYDGPCPPWNDERLHHYYFQVYALDVNKLTLKEGFTGKDVVKAMDGHIVGKGETMGTYTNNKVGVKP
jgi:Raf kinase inhibitor-like YbhB/YbcL family protein